MAAEGYELLILQEIFKCAKGKITTEEENNNLLLATDYRGKAVFKVWQPGVIRNNMGVG